MSGDAAGLGSRILEYMVYVLIGIVVIMVIANVGAPLQSGAATVEHPRNGTAEVLDSSIQYMPDNVDVRATTEHAMYFDGDVAINASRPTGLTNGNLTVCAVATLDSQQNATYDLVSYANESVMLQFDHGNWSFYYDNGSRDAVVQIDAPSLASLSPVCGRVTGDAISVRDANDYATANLTSNASSRNVSWGWNGTVDEVRLFNSSVSNSTIDTYLDDPVKPLPGATRSARFMFDEGSGSTTRVFFTDETVDVSGASWTSGILNPRKWLGLASEISRGNDYRVSVDPFAVTVLSNGYLAGAPIVYVNWTGAGSLPFDVIDLLGLFIALLLIVYVARNLIGVE